MDVQDIVVISEFQSIEEYWIKWNEKMASNFYVLSGSNTQVSEDTL